MCAMLQQQRVLSVSWRIVWCIELGWTPHAIPPPWPASAPGSPHFSRIRHCWWLWAVCHHLYLYILVLHLSTTNCCIYLFTDVMMLLMLWWRDRRHWLQGGTRDTWHVFIPDISLHHYTRTTARSRATRILCYNSLLLWWWWTVMMAVCSAVMMPGAVKTLRWLAPWWRAWLGARGQRSRCPAWSSLTPSLTCEGAQP